MSLLFFLVYFLCTFMKLTLFVRVLIGSWGMPPWSSFLTGSLGMLLPHHDSRKLPLWKEKAGIITNSWSVDEKILFFLLPTPDNFVVSLFSFLPKSIGHDHVLVRPRSAFLKC